MTQSQRRDVLKAAGTVAVIGGLAGCAEDEEPVDGEEGEAPADEPEETQEEEEPEDDVGAFRVAHASPDAPNVDVYFDEQAVIEDLGFREVSPYEEVEPGSYQVQVTAADDPDTVVFDEEIEVEAGVTNTAVAFGEAAGGPENGFEVELLEDDITDPGEDTSRVRLFHASPDAEDVDIVVTEAPEAIGEEEEPGEEEAPEEGEEPDEEPEEDEPEETQQDEEEPPDEEAEPEDEEMPDEEEPEDEPEDEPAEEPQVGEPLFEGVGFGDSETGEIPAGDYTLEVVPAEADPEEEEEEPEDEETEDEEMPDEEPEDEPENDEPEETQQEEAEPEDDPDEEDESDEEPVDEFELSTESQSVYSAFAVGYVDPEEAETEEEEAFEVVTVEDATEGERADGGTDGNGLLSLQH